MTKLFAWLGVAMLVMVCASSAYAGDPLKPYVVLILDTSGSMNAPTGSGPPSCGGTDTRIEHATCAINRIVNSYGDMVFALGRFRETTNGTFATSCDANNDVRGDGGDQCTTQGRYCGATSTSGRCTCLSNNDCTETDGTTHNCVSGICAGTTQCTTADRELEMLTGLVDGNNQLAAGVTDRTCTSCSMPTGGTVTTANEIWGVHPSTFTPLAAVMNGAKLYWNGTSIASDGSTVIWPSNAPGFAPIFNDPTKAQFLPTGCNPAPSCTSNCCASQCRPYITILLTDGDETCTSFSNTTAAAASMTTTDVSNRRYYIKTTPIGFGINPGDPDIEAIADAGSRTPALDNGFYASDEQSLQLAISSILDDAIKTETCNNLDDDCDVLVDEDFPGKGGTCNNGRPGVCRVNGNNQCRVDGQGLFCNAGVDACDGPDNISGNADDVPAGGACNTQNAAGVTHAGTCQGGACVITPLTEVCNNLDDDCDGKVDENLTNCTCAPQGEICDNMDQDCDTRIDEGVTRPCGVGVCLGTQTCAAGAFGQCLNGGNPVQTPTTEVCNGLDDDCDGIRDGLQAACSTMPPLPPEFFPVDRPENNPGHPTNNPIAANVCRPGQKTCPIVAGPPNSFGACTGEIKACANTVTTADDVVDGCPDLCDGLDIDCDNIIDEDFQAADCSSNCGIGTTMCVNGQIVCNSVPVGNDNTCNNIDDDCDNKIDEGWVSPGACGAGPPPTVCNGVVQCQSGVEVCVGDPVGQESCNCDDDDCDNKVDEGSLCGAGSSCKACQCAMPCANDEFPCPMGKFCKAVGNCSNDTFKTCTIDTDCTTGGTCVNKADFCLADPCFNVVCPPVNGAKQVCQQNSQANNHTCVSACSIANCSATEVCIPATGECKPDNCNTFPEKCSANQLCIAGNCVTNLCQGVTCAGNQYCVQGECFGSCAGVTCPDGKRCRMGVCENDPCGHPCPFGQVCIEAAGECRPDPCASIPCPEGQYCNPQTIACEDDPCAGTTCPGAGQICKGGTCFDEDDLKPDAPQGEHVTTGGGGGCSTGAGGGWLAIVAFGFLALRRRRRGAGGVR
jgi:MYXO-CTERM domain-containing protein